MSRSVADATRFTATSPHAFTKPTTSRLAAAKAASPTPRSIPPQSRQTTPTPGQNSTGPVETPAQKVARLRAAHAAKRASEISAWDRIVVRGREIADSAHRITVMGLVTFTVVAGVVTTYSLGDMILYNRRKKREWYAEQHTKWQEALVLAREAEVQGTANNDQILLLNRERAAEAADEEKRNRPSIWKTIKSLFSFEGLNKEEKPLQEKKAGGEQELEVSRPEKLISYASEEQRQDAERAMGNRNPKPSSPDERAERVRGRTLDAQKNQLESLDRMAEEATEAVTLTSGKSWSSWFSK